MLVKFNIEPKNIDFLYVKQYLTILYPILDSYKYSNQIKNSWSYVLCIKCGRFENTFILWNLIYLD